MKKVSFRSSFAVIMALLIAAGLVLFIFRYVKDGKTWALYFDEATSNSICTISDRNGVVLAKKGQGGQYYAETAELRKACYHLIGDYSGNIGTGALRMLLGQASEYSLVTGIKDKESIDLRLTVDSRLNVKALNALGDRKGAVIVSNYKTNEILCMVSTPTADPTELPKELPDGLFINRAISSSFTPGSVFKLVTLAAAIENIDGLYQRSFTCDGDIEVMGVKVTCTGTHGTQTIEQALANSCNCVFGTLALELGADTLSEYAEKLGFLDSHRLDGITTAKGSFTKDESKSAALAWSGIGQYNDMVCPYSMLRCVSAIANAGKLTEPSLVGNENKTTQLLSEETAGKIASMMNYNVVYKYGEENFPGLKISAKTGTAELGDGLEPHGWFVGFLNDEEHPYAFTVIVENGGTGLYSAGAVAYEVLKAAVDYDDSGDNT